MFGTAPAGRGSTIVAVFEAHAETGLQSIYAIPYRRTDKLINNIAVIRENLFWETLSSWEHLFVFPF